jgi:hypothetical protein
MQRRETSTASWGRCRDEHGISGECRDEHGVTEELKVGRDGAVRTVVLRGANGTVLVRPIQLVIPLEVDQGGEDVEDP